MLAKLRDDAVLARDVAEYLLDDPSDEAYEDHRVQGSWNKITCILGETADSTRNVIWMNRCISHVRPAIESLKQQFLYIMRSEKTL